MMFLITVFGPETISAQRVKGLWLSEDGSRTYQVHEKDGNLYAVLYASVRKTDKAGDTILSELSADKRKDTYTGSIHSTIHPAKRFVKISMHHDKLELKIPRLIFFPVKIYWYRKDADVRRL